MEQLRVPDFMLHVVCMTYNHSPYIVETLNGFTLQQTDFPFVCVVIDDASTDGEQEVIKQYYKENFDWDNPSVTRNEETDDYILTFARHKTNHNCFFAVLYLKYNHYSIGKSKNPYYEKWTHTKYRALCEGDDYWTDPYKLQKQVDYLESHPECTLVCNRTKIKSEKYLSFMDDNCCLNNDGVLDAKDVIRKGGLYISTCSLIYRSSLTSFYPEYCKKCHVGDYPLQILAAMKGSVYYLNDPMSVYRVNNPMSWVGRTASKSIKESYLKGTRTEVDMLKGFATEYTNYRSVFFQRIGFFITSVIYNYRNDLQSAKLIKDEYQDDINCFCLLWKLRVFFISHNLCGLRKLYSFFFNCFIKPKFE